MEDQLSEDTEALQVKDAQRTTAKRATLEMMRAKGRRPKEFEGDLNGERVSFLLLAIGSQEYDKHLTECPPTTAQKAENHTYNQDKFAPRLMARVYQEPKLSEDEWTEIWTSPDWSRGETGELFWTAVNLCGQGLNLTPTEAG